MPSFTPNHGFIVPTEGGDEDLWGQFINENIAKLDRDIIKKGPFGDRPTAGQEGRWYMATDRNPPELYYDTGTQWRGILTTGDYVQRSGDTMSGKLDIQHSSASGTPWINHQYIGTPGASNRYVILLEPYGGGHTNRTAGTVVATRGSSTNPTADMVNVVTKGSNGTAHPATLEVLRGSTGGTNQWRFVTCDYNGTTYLALDFDARTVNRSHSAGVFFTGVSNSNGAEHLRLIDYADYSASTIINSEIFNSLSPLESTGTQKRIKADSISLEGKAQVNRSPTSSSDIATKGYVDTHGGGGGGGGSAATIHIDNFGADPTGNSSSDAALEAAVAEAEPNDRIALTDGDYRFDDRHIFTKSLTFDGSAGTVITTYNASYTEDLEACFSFRGERTHEMSLVGDVKRNDQVISVSDASVFSADDGVLIRQHGYLARSYKPTRDVIERVDEATNTIRLKKGAQYDYTASDPNTFIGRIDPIVRPRYQNMTFVSGEGNIPVQTRFCRDAIYDDVAIVGYARHAIVSWDDLGTRFRNCETSNPTSLDASSGEAFMLIGGTDITINNPRIRSARRGIDIRSGAQNVVVNEPNMSDITLHGISFHNDGTSHVNGSIKVVGGVIAARQTDPDMSAYQTGNGFNSSKNATYQKFIGTTFRTRNRGGDIYGNNVTCIDCHFEPVEDTGDLVEIHTDSTNTRFKDCHWTNAGRSVGRAVYLRDNANDIELSGSMSGTFSQAGVRYDTVQDVKVDLDMTLDTGLYYHFLAVNQTPENIQIEGTLRGPGVTSECIAMESGDGVDVDVFSDGSRTSTVRPVRMYHPNGVTIRGHFKTTGIGALISGNADGVNFDGLTVESDGGAYAVGGGSAIAGTAPRNVRVTGCNLAEGTSSAISFNVAVDGLWVVGNSSASVTYAGGTNVIWEAGNGVPSS